MYAVKTLYAEDGCLGFNGTFSTNRLYRAIYAEGPAEEALNWRGKWQR